jgi:hypothetical protein
MDFPLFVTASVLVVAVFAVLAVAFVLNRFAPGHVGRSVGLALAVWLVATAFLASSGVYRPASDEAVPPIGIVLAVALATLGLAVAAVPQLRTVLGDPAAQPPLLALQVWRIEGIAFLVLLAVGQLPALFAVPAGVGDLTIGLTAPFMARNLHRRNLALAWNLFGLADLVLAISLGVTTNPGLLSLFVTTPTSELLTAFPMAIIPTFLVPLSIGLHVVSMRHVLSADVHHPSGAPALASN